MIKVVWVTSPAKAASRTWRSAVEYTRLTWRLSNVSKATSESCSTYSRNNSMSSGDDITLQLYARGSQNQTTKLIKTKNVRFFLGRAYISRVLLQTPGR